MNDQVNKKEGLLSWEEAIIKLRSLPEHKDLIFYSYLSDNLVQNCDRFQSSGEFSELLRMMKELNPTANTLLDLAAGNGIASHAFAKAGYKVTALEPDPSDTVGRGAIEFIRSRENTKNLELVSGYGEALPFADNTFDIVYLRQALHHAHDINKMVKEIYRVLKKDGLFFATREHVVDNYNEGLQEFLDAQVDHQLYGGENAFTLKDYLAAIKSNKFKVLNVLGPYDSIINWYPADMDDIERGILKSKKGKLLNTLFGRKIAIQFVMYLTKRQKNQGRIYSFISIKK